MSFLSFAQNFPDYVSIEKMMNLNKTFKQITLNFKSSNIYISLLIAEYDGTFRINFILKL